MFLTLRCARAVSFLVVFVLASCAQEPFSSVDRSKYKTVALNPEMKVPDHYVYRDITGKRSRGMMVPALRSVRLEACATELSARP